jgi:predicted DNA-binding protein (UPF0278 family)
MSKISKAVAEFNDKFEEVIKLGELDKLTDSDLILLESIACICSRMAWDGS